jgi:Gpi18-like mannosyltransferase
MTSELKKTTVFGIEIVSDPPNRRLWERVRILLLLLLGFTAFNYLYNGLFRPLSTEKVDFVAYYNVAIAFKHGLPIYDHMIQFFQEGILDYKGPNPYVYPPGFVIILSPLAYLSFEQASLLWNLLNHIFFLLGIVLLMKAIKNQYSWGEWITLIFVCMNFTPLFMDYLVGQCNTLLFFLVAAGLYFYRVNQRVCTGIALALATMIKIIPGLLLAYMLWKRQFRIFVSGLILLALITAYSLLFFDADLYVWYFKFMGNQDLFNAYHDNHALTGFFTRFLVDSVWTKGMFNSPGTARVAIFASSALMLFFLFYVTRKKHDRSDERNLREYSLVVLTMLLTSKMTSTPYLVMLLIPLAVLVHELFQKRPVTRWIIPLGAAYGLLAVWYPLPAGKFLNMDVYTIYLKGPQVHIFSLQFFALLVLWLYFAFAPYSDETHFPVDGAYGKDDQSE